MQAAHSDEIVVADEHAWNIELIKADIKKPTRCAKRAKEAMQA